MNRSYKMSQHKMKTILAKRDPKTGFIIPPKNTKPGVYKVEGMNKIVTITAPESQVQQSDQHLTDINRLLEPAMRKGALRHSIKFAGKYDDIPYRDYQDAQYKIAEAKTMYEELPSNIRQEFDNPGKFLEFVQNPANADRMKQMGILKGNDGKTAQGAPSGAPTQTDMDGDGIPDPKPTTPQA
jgi:hypothetical protein